MVRTLIKMQFDPDVAKEVGTDAAIILSNIEFWIAKNRQDEERVEENRRLHYKDRAYWTYNSVKDWLEFFPYLTYDKVRRNLEKLEKGGYIISKQFNKNTWDHTKWYTSTRLECPVDKANMPIQTGVEAQSLYTYNKPNDKHHTYVDTSFPATQGACNSSEQVPKGSRSDSLASQRSSAKSSKQESSPTASFYDFEQEHSGSNFSELATQASPTPNSAHPLPSARTQKQVSEVKELLAKVIEIVKPGSKLTAKRVSAMKARLNDYTPEEIIEAAKWFKADDWRQSAESRAKGWNSVDYLIRPSGMQRYGEMGKFNKQTTQESNLARINRLMKAQRS